MARVTGVDKPALLLCFLAGCATTAETTEAPLRNERGTPFIKLAQRDLGLVVYFAGDELRPGEQEDLERSIAARLKNTYRTPVLSYRRSGSFISFAPELEAELALKSVDDVVIVELAAEGGKFHGRVQVLVLADLRAAVDRTFSVAMNDSGAPPIAKIADSVWFNVTRHFTDPGANPRVDSLIVADRLATAGACNAAIELYPRALAGRKGTSLLEATAIDESRERFAECKRKKAMEAELERDAVATYALTLEAQDLPPRVEDAVRSVFGSSGLEKKLAKHTRKPAVLRVTGAGFVLSIRYDLAAFLAASEDRPQFVSGERALYLDAYFDVMRELSAYREEVADQFEGSQAESLRDLPLTLRLTKPGGDSASIDFATLDDRVLLTDTIRMRRVGIGEVPVASGSSTLLREGTFILGSATVDGGTTAAALVYQFFEIE